MKKKKGKKVDLLLELYQALLARKRLRGLNDLFFLNKHILETDKERKEMLVPHVHGEWSAWYHSGKRRIKMLLVPRGSFKTTFFTVGLSLQKILRNRDERILLANATISNSQKFLFEIKEKLTKNSNITDLYGEFYDPNLKWSENEIIIKGRSSFIRESTITTVGVGGNLVSQHYDTIICDDLVNRENSESRYLAEKTIDWWQRSFSLLEPDGEMFVIGTRWSAYDLYSFIEDNFKTIADTYIKGVYNKDGGLYFPERFNKDKIEELKNLHGEYIFSSFYENNPRDSKRALIKEDNLVYYDVLPDKLEFFMAVDPAVSKGAKADYTAMIVVGIDKQGNWYVVDTLKEKLTTNEMFDQVFFMYKKWRPTTISLELIGQAIGLRDYLFSLEQQKNIFLPIYEINSRESGKEIRIISILQPRFENGKILIREDMVELIDEILKFPFGKHEDLIDALSDISEIVPFYEDQPFSGKNREDNSLPDFFNQHLKSFLNRKPFVDPDMGVHF